nr:hypothetical protein [Tanacetum cinerariifolium]
MTAEEKKTRKIDHLARSLLIQGLPNDIYSLIDSNKTAKDLWDALERRMHGSEYGEQHRKAAILYEYETFKATEGEQLLDTYLRYLQVINDLKKCGYKKDNCDVNDALGFKKKVVVITLDPLALVAEKTKITALLAKAFNRRKFCSKPTNNNLRTSSTSQSANKKQEFVKSDDKKVEKKDDEKKRDMSKVKCYNCKKEGYFAKDCKKAKVKDYNYYKIKMFVAKKDSDKQVLLVEHQAWMESNSDESSSSAEETITEVAYYTSESGSESEYKTSEYYDNSNNYGLFVNDNDDQEIFHDVIESASENLIENHIDSQKDYDKSEKRIEKANQQSKDLENQNKDLQEKYDVLINQVNTFEEQNNEFNEQIKVLNVKNAVAQMEVLQDQLKQTSSLKPYVLTVILEKIIIDLEDEVVSLLEKEKANLKTIESLKSKGFESSENAISESENQSEKECDQVENSKVIALGMSKLSVSQSVSPISIHSKLNKDVKRYSRKDLLSCNNSHLGETSSAYVCNDAMNDSYDSRFCNSFDENNLFIFNDESVRISPVNKMPFRKKPHDSLNLRSKCNSNQSLPRTVHRWLPKMQPLAEPVAKWFPRVKRQINKISKTPNSPGPSYKWVPKVC